MSVTTSFAKEYRISLYYLVGGGQIGCCFIYKTGNQLDWKLTFICIVRIKLMMMNHNVMKTYNVEL